MNNIRPVCVHRLTRTSRGAWVGHQSLPRCTTPITQSQPTSTVGSLLCASPCAPIRQWDKCYSNCSHGYATFASGPLCQAGEWNRRWRQAERSSCGVSFTLRAWEIYLTSCTLYLNTEDIPNIPLPLLGRGCTGFATQASPGTSWIPSLWVLKAESLPKGIVKGLEPGEQVADGSSDTNALMSNCWW